MTNLYTTPLSQAWLRFWVDLYGADSLLAKYLIPVPRESLRPLLPEPVPVPPEPEPEPEEPPFLSYKGIVKSTVVPPGQSRPRKLPAPPPPPIPPQKLKERQARPALPRPPRPPKVPAQPRVRVDRQIQREAARLVDKPLADWAKKLIGDNRISDITLEKLIAGMDNYFDIFSGMRRVNTSAYKFFSNIGAPITVGESCIWRWQLDQTVIPNADKLPSYFGVFFTKDPTEEREEIYKDGPYFPEFVFFEKLKNAPTFAPHGTTIFSHNEVSLDQHVLSKEEAKKFPWAKRNWGVHWLVGVLPDGTIKPLPCRMTRSQLLPRRARHEPTGGTRHHYVHSSRFCIPEGLVEWGMGDADQLVRSRFNMALAFTATAISGAQLTLKKNGVTARIGVPISVVRDFFSDRDRVDGERRKPLMNLILPHERHYKDGHITIVGEHLRGTRFFNWRGYEMSIGAPGLHYPSIEGFDAGVYDFEQPLPPECDGEKMKAIETLAPIASNQIWRRDRRLQFRKGSPNQVFRDANLPSEADGPPKLPSAESPAP